MTLFIQNPGTCLLSKYDRIPEINGTQCDRVKYNDNIEDIDVNDVNVQRAMAPFANVILGFLRYPRNRDGYFQTPLPPDSHWSQVCRCR